MEISNSPGKEFKEIVKRMLTKLRKRMRKLSEDFNKDLKTYKKKIRVKEYDNLNLKIH